MRTLYTATVTAMGLLMFACGTPEEPAEAPSEEPSGAEQPTDDVDGVDDTDAADRGTQLDLGDHCENPEDGYRIRYPESWHANDGRVTAPCRAFDVEVPDIQPDTVLPLASSALVTVEERGFDEVRTLIEEDPATEVRDVEEGEIADRSVLRVDGVATGEAYLDEGVEVHRTYVELGDRILIASSNELGEPDLDVRRDLIADMLATLEPIDRRDDATDDATDDTDDATDGTDDTTGTDEGTDEASEGTDQLTSLIGEAGRSPRGDGDGSGYLVDVRLGHHDGFSRLTLEFEESVPEYEVAPTDGPILAHPSGEDLEVGGEAYLEIVTSGTSVDLTGDEAIRTYGGPHRFDGDGSPIVEVTISGDHHGVMSWVIGLSGEADFAVADIEDPARIVVDVVDTP